MTMPAWFDIYELGMHAKEDVTGIQISSQTLNSFISEEIEKRNIDPKKIVFGGFSQGGAVSLYNGLTEENLNVGGIVALSTWLPNHKEFLDKPSGHGSADAIVPHAFGFMTNQIIGKFGFTNTQFKSYEGMQHSSCPKELEDLKEFLKNILG